MISTARKLALQRVRSEDLAAYDKRVSDYESEINEAFSRIESAKMKSEKSVTIVFASAQEFEKARRVKEALESISYTCSDINSKEGAWVNGSGHEKFLALEVSGP